MRSISKLGWSLTKLNLILPLSLSLSLQGSLKERRNSFGQVLFLNLERKRDRVVWFIFQQKNLCHTIMLCIKPLVLCFSFWPSWPPTETKCPFYFGHEGRKIGNCSWFTLLCVSRWRHPNKKGVQSTNTLFV